MPKTDHLEDIRAQDVCKQQMNLDKVSSAVLARLIEEVRNKETAIQTMYNRFHNRHNRS
jgi:hypothetical protein